MAGGVDGHTRACAVSRRIWLFHLCTECAIEVLVSMAIYRKNNFLCLTLYVKKVFLPCQYQQNLSAAFLGHRH
jgi:hypothetical protein